MNIKKLKPNITEKMETGTKLHSIFQRLNHASKNLEEAERFIEHQKTIYLEYEKELSNVLAFLKERQKKELKIFPAISESTIEFRINNFKLKGIVDAVYEFENEFEIFEYKKSFYKSKIEDFFTETSFYSFLFENNQRRKIVRMGLFSFETGEVLYKEYNEKLSKEIEEKINYIIDKIDKNDFEPTPTQENCKHCHLKEFCEYAYNSKNQSSKVNI